MYAFHSTVYCPSYSIDGAFSLSLRAVLFSLSVSFDCVKSVFWCCLQKTLNSFRIGRCWPRLASRVVSVCGTFSPSSPPCPGPPPPSPAPRSLCVPVSQSLSRVFPAMLTRIHTIHTRTHIAERSHRRVANDNNNTSKCR